jgi:CheY-like chemotaxis protein
MSAKRILIVDDDKIAVDAFTRLLNDAGYDILSAADGSDAVSIARHEKPDLIILDLVFPPDVSHGGGVPWDGFLIMDWLQRQSEAKDIPVVVVTAADADQNRNRAYAKGAIGFFQKPINGGELVDLVQKVLGDESHQTTLSVRLPGSNRQ